MQRRRYAALNFGHQNSYHMHRRLKCSLPLAQMNTHMQILVTAWHSHFSVTIQCILHPMDKLWWTLDKAREFNYVDKEVSVSPWVGGHFWGNSSNKKPFGDLLPNRSAPPPPTNHNPVQANVLGANNWNPPTAGAPFRVLSIRQTMKLACDSGWLLEL